MRADADYISGYAAIIDHYETSADGIGGVYGPGIVSSSQTYQNYLDEVEEHNVTLSRRGRMTRFRSRLSTPRYSHPRGLLANDDRNENSVVVQL